MAGADPAQVSDAAKRRQRDEMGTLGSGNHYLELQHVVGIHDRAIAEAFGLAVGDVVVVDRLSGDAGATVQLPALLLVDGEKVTSDAASLAKITVTAEIVRDEKGPKIEILKFKNKTGYRKRMGHRQRLTRLKVTGIN